MKDWNSGFCNSGQALRAEWHEGEARDWDKKPVHQSLQLQTAQNELHLFFMKTWINQKSIYLASIQSRYIEHQPNTNAHSINPKSMLIAADSLLVVFSSLKTFILRSMPLTCHSARSWRRSRRIHKHRGIKYYLDSPLRKKTRLRVSITPPKIDKILERKILL